MKGDFPPYVVVAVIGAVTFLMLDLHFVTSWEELYATAAWPGLQETARGSLVEPWFGSTPMSLRLTQGTLFLLATIVSLMRTEDAGMAGLALWVGVLIPLVPVLLGRTILSGTALTTFAPMSDRPLIWMAVPVEAVRVGVPILVGVVAGGILSWMGRALFGS